MKKKVKAAILSPKSSYMCNEPYIQHNRWVLVSFNALTITITGCTNCPRKLRQLVVSSFNCSGIKNTVILIARALKIHEYLHTNYKKPGDTIYGHQNCCFDARLSKPLRTHSFSKIGARNLDFLCQFYCFK